MAFTATKFYDKCVFYPPLLKDPNTLPQAIKMIEDECARQEGAAPDIRGLTKEQAGLLDNEKYIITTDRGNSDYIYSRKETARRFLSCIKNGTQTPTTKPWR
jgi:hypothetical protein